MASKKPLPPYAARRFKDVAVLVKEAEDCDGAKHALCRATKDFSVWKKIVRDRTCYPFKLRVIELTIKKGTLFWCHENSPKCRAFAAISKGKGESKHQIFGLTTNYEPGKKIVACRADYAAHTYRELKVSEFKIDSDICASGVHFFAFKSTAQRYDFT